VNGHAAATKAFATVIAMLVLGVLATGVRF
jgi:hypothetical protein